MLKRRTVRWFAAAFCAACASLLTASRSAADELAERFSRPPAEARPLTWWHWLDGNVTREGITADWEAIQRAGLGGAYLFNCGIGMPAGDVRFLQPKWLEMMDHTLGEAQRLGLKFGVHNCDGFSQSGGPWITAEMSMKELTWTARDFQGPAACDEVLEVPPSKQEFYRDIAVLAFPLPQGDRLSGAGLRGTLAPDELAKLTDGSPQTSAVFPGSAGNAQNVVEFAFAEPQTVRSIVVRNASPHRWEEDFPIQISVSSDGKEFRPIGSFTANWDLLGGGAVTAACDEATGKVFRLTFQNPWPVSCGEIELSETARVHFAEAKAGRLRSRGHGAERRHHDAYPGPDRNRALAPELTVARRAVKDLTAQLAADGRLTWDVPPGRWRILRVGFTSNGHYVSPATAEGRGLECDKLAAETVRFHLDQYVGQLLERAGPAAGKTLAAMEVDSWECGIQNWTAGLEQRFRERLGYDLLPFLPALLEGWIVDSADVTECALWDWRRFLADQFAENYFQVFARWAADKGLTRCNYLLREGQPVADVLFFVGEDVPNRIAWRDELRPILPAGYDFDGCDVRALREARVENGRVVLASGTEYRVLLLPNLPTMRPEVLQKVGELAAAGATVLGPRPQQSPSLRDLGEGDRAVRSLAEELWNGRVISGVSFDELFQRIGLPPDFESRTAAPDGEVLYVHRRVGDAEVYFVSNQKNRYEDVTAMFRVADRAPELFDPATGAVTRPGVFRCQDGRLHVPLRLEPNGSVFVVFREPLPARYVTAVEPEPAAAPVAPAAVPGPTVAAAQGTFTLCLWVKPADSTALPAVRQTPLALRGQNWAVFAEPGHGLYGDGHAGCGLGVGRNGVCVLEHSARYAPAVISHAAEIKSWTHLGLVYQQGVPRLVVNGVEVGQGSAGPHIVHASTGQTGPAFRGERTPVQLFDRVLTVQEIAALAAQPPEASLTSPAWEIERTADGQLVARCSKPAAHAMLVWNDGTRGEVHAPAAPEPMELAGPWQVAFPPNLGAPASATFDKLISLSDHSDPGIRFFSGTTTYRTTFAANASPPDSQVFLDLGDVQVIAEVRLNDRDLGIHWKPPFLVDVTSAIRAGENELEVRVTNLWPNRMIGDAALPDDVVWNRERPAGAYPASWPAWLVQGQPRPSGRIAFCTRKDVYAKNDPLLPSGLIGPVRLVTVGEVTLGGERHASRF